MRAVAYSKPLPITDQNALVDIDLPVPEPTGHDLLVEIKAISVNPVDVKVRANRAPLGGQPMVLGWDAAGVVTKTGPDATLFKPGDRVFYAGAINRQGSNAEYQLVDERIVGRMPASLDFAEAAALPLTTITAYEALFDRLRVRDAVPGSANALLIIGGAGGVGSIAIQLARADGPHRDCDRLSTGDGGLGQGTGHPSCRRPFEAPGGPDRSTPDRPARLRLLDHAF